MRAILIHHAEQIAKQRQEQQTMPTPFHNVQHMYDPYSTQATNSQQTNPYLEIPQVQPQPCYQPTQTHLADTQEQYLEEQWLIWNIHKYLESDAQDTQLYVDQAQYGHMTQGDEQYQMITPGLMETISGDGPNSFAYEERPDFQQTHAPNQNTQSQPDTDTSNPPIQ